MKNVLITGGAGFIGSQFIKYIINNSIYQNIFVIDKLTYAGNLENIQIHINKNEINFIKGDICNINLVTDILLDNNIDIIINFAAESHVDRSIASPIEFINTNINGTFSLLESAIRVWKKNFSSKRFHHISTDEVYGELKDSENAFTEETSYAPRSPYAASKASSDHLVKSYFATYGLPVTISNCSNNYGPNQNKEKLIPLVITNILQGLDIPVYGDGKNIRDWLYVEDHCIGIQTIIDKGLIGETYNIGGYNEISNIELVKLISTLIDEKFENNQSIKKKYPNNPTNNGKKSLELIKFVTDRLGHDKRYAINAEKIEKNLGFFTRTSFEEGIKSTIDWYMNNVKWWMSSK